MKKTKQLYLIEVSAVFAVPKKRDIVSFARP